MTEKVYCSVSNVDREIARALKSKARFIKDMRKGSFLRNLHRQGVRLTASERHKAYPRKRRLVSHWRRGQTK